MSQHTVQKMTFAEWEARGKELFGDKKLDWKFKCPVCGFVQSMRDYKEAGAPMSAIGFSCIGRWREKCRDAFREKGKGPCNYAGGGLFRMNPVHVSVPPRGDDEAYVRETFEFAEHVG